jgi:hypothetical protein
MHGEKGGRWLTPHTLAEKLVALAILVGLVVAVVDTGFFEYAHPELGTYDAVSSVATLIVTISAVVWAIMVYDRHKTKQAQMHGHLQ